MRKRTNMVFTVIVVYLILGVFIIFFDEDYFNDSMGWIILLGF